MGRKEEIEHEEDAMRGADDDYIGDQNDSRTQLQSQNDRLVNKIKALQTSLTATHSAKSSLNSSSTRSVSKHSIRTKYDEVRKKLHAGMNDSKCKNRSKHLVRNWNKR